MKLIIGTTVATVAAQAVVYPLAQADRLLLGLAASVLVSSALVVTLLTLVVMRPVRRIIDANLRLSDGDLEDSVIQPSQIPGDEIGTIMVTHNLILERMGAVLERLEKARKDVTDHKQKLHENYLVLEEIKDDITEKHSRLKEVDKRKSEFLASMSHELRTPMNSIIGLTELTLKTNAEQMKPAGRRNLERAARSAHELLKLINDILDLSKIEAGEVSVVKEEFNLGELVDHCLSTVEPLVGDKNIEMEVRMDGTFDRLRLDRIKTRQIILNLLGNAVKFTERGKISVAVDAVGGPDVPAAPENGQSYLRIIVSDTGVGIDPGHLEHIFEQFRQVDGRSGGTGLGLYIVKKLTEVLGGTATVESRPREGTTFTVVLPYEKTGEDWVPPPRIR